MKFTKESFRRALRTFIQVVVSYILANIVVIDFTSSKEIVKSAILGLIISALSAGFAAVMNMEVKNNDNGT